MNTLSQEKQTQVLSMLVEGTSIRSIERITGVHRDTNRPISDAGWRSLRQLVG